MKILFIDNLGFTDNLIDEFKKKECEVVSYRNTVDIKVIDTAIKNFKPNLIVISSGPEKDSGNSVDVIRNHCGKTPIFGVGLGLSCIIEAFEGKVNRSSIINHGKITKINHDGKTIFKKIDNPFNAGTYNSYSGYLYDYFFPTSLRRLSIIKLPSKVNMLEGSNCTPSTKYSLCLTPITISFWLLAETSKLKGISDPE